MATRRERSRVAAPRVSIVVVAWRDAPLLGACLDSLAAGVGDVAYELVLSLNEPSEQLERFASLILGATVVTSRVNLGYGAAANAGVARSRGEHVVLLNDDAKVQVGWLEALVETADRRPEVGAVGSLLVFPDGTVQESGAVLWSDGTATNVGRGLEETSLGHRAERVVDYCSACSLLVRRSTWERVGGFDDAYYPAYYEDVDLCLKIAAAGEQVVVQPRSRVEHRLSASTSGAFRSFLLDRNRLVLLERWGAELASRFDPAPDDPLAVARAVARAAGRPPVAWVLVDEHLAGPLAAAARRRLELAARALLAGDEVELVEVGLDSDPADAPEPSLALLALPALAWPDARFHLAGYPDLAVVLDGETLRADAFVDDEARDAELEAAAEAGYVVCEDEETAEALGLDGDPVPAADGLLLHLVRGHGPVARGSRRRARRAPRSGGDGPRRFAGEDPTAGEVAALERDLALQREFAGRLESQVKQLLGDVERRDEAVERSEQYARRLEAQVDELADELVVRKAEVVDREAEILALLDEQLATLGRRQAQRFEARSGGRRAPGGPVAPPG